MTTNTVSHVAHGVIQIDVKNLRSKKVAAALSATNQAGAVANHSLSTGPAPGAVVRHITHAQVEAEAAALQAAAAQLESDSVNAQG
jgi:hypothetical protein